MIDVLLLALPLMLLAVLPVRTAELPEGATSHFASVNGIRLHYVQMGRGPLMVLLHGWPETWFEWAHLMPRLAQRFTVVAPDLRGTGLSEKAPTGYDKLTLSKDVAALIRHVGRGQAIVVGHDIGGKAAYLLGLLEPELVSKLVLIDYSPPGTEKDVRNGGSWHYGFHAAEEIPELLTKGREREYLMTMMRGFMHKKDAMAPEAIEAYVASYSTPGGMTAGFNFYRSMIEDGRFYASLGRHRFKMPILTIGGRFSTRDRLFKTMRRVADDVIGAIAEDSGHFVPEEAPDFTVEQIMAFSARGARQEPRP
jgi:pimeloyl-ACP methyl ester carboxylesterase